MRTPRIIELDEDDILRIVAGKETDE